MKSKVIVVVVLSILITALCCCSLGTVLAEEIEISIMEYRSGDLSDDEIDFAISNLQYKLESDDLPRLIRADVIYDLNGEGLYGLYEFKNYYMIVIRQTGSVMERGEGNSVYYGIKSDKKYYGGYGNYFISSNDGFKNIITGEILTLNLFEDTKEKMKELRELDYQDYLEAMSTPTTYGAGNRERIKKLGNSISEFVEIAFGDKNYLYNYFAEQINIDFLKIYSPTYTPFTIDRVLYSFTGIQEKEYGFVVANEFEYGYDVLYPKNLYNSCSVTAMGMVLLYYYRTINENIIPYDLIDEAETSLNMIKKSPIYSLSEVVAYSLFDFIKVLNVPDDTYAGAATYVNIDAAFERFFDYYGMQDEKSTHFTSYTNMKKAIDGGHPSIMTIGVGTGYDINNNKESVSGHNVVAYGYTTNSIGVIDEFVCHSGWYSVKNSNSEAECAKLFINKFSAAGNVYLHY